MKKKVNKPGYEWLKNPAWATLLTMAGLLFSSIAGVVFSLVVFGGGVDYGYLVSTSSITVLALFIVYILRKPGNYPWSGLQLHVKWTAVLEVIAGFVLACLTMFLSDMISVMFGAADRVGTWEHHLEEGGCQSASF